MAAFVADPVEANLAHLYQVSRGAPGWGNSQRWALEGQTPSVSNYDQPCDKSDDPFWRRIWAGIFNTQGRLPLSAPTMTRHARASAQINSTPAAVFFNALAGTTGSGAGTGRAWSGGAVALSHPWIHQNFNPNQQGAAELHAATSYDPYPSPGSLYPKVV